MPANHKPWTGSHRLLGVPKSLGHPRYVDMIQVAYWDWLRQKKTPKSTPRWFCDITQSIERKPWGEDVSAFAQKSLPYSFELDRVLDGEETTRELCMTTVKFFPAQIGLGGVKCCVFGLVDWLWMQRVFKLGFSPFVLHIPIIHRTAASQWVGRGPQSSSARQNES